MNAHLVFFIERIFVGKFIKNMFCTDILFYGELYSAHGNGISKGQAYLIIVERIQTAKRPLHPAGY